MLGRERAIHHKVAQAQRGSVTQKVEEAELHWSLEKRSCGDTQREAWERHQHFTVEKGQGVKGEVLCISFELSANLFRKKCEISHPEIMG